MGRLSNCVCACVCACVYTLFSSSLSSSKAKSDGTVGPRKLPSQTGTLSPIAASLACTASGGRDCGDSRPAGVYWKEKRRCTLMNASKLNRMCQVETMEWCQKMRRLSSTECQRGFKRNKRWNMYAQEFLCFVWFCVKAGMVWTLNNAVKGMWLQSCAACFCLEVFPLLCLSVLSGGGFRLCVLRLEVFKFASEWLFFTRTVLLIAHN